MQQMLLDFVHPKQFLKADFIVTEVNISAYDYVINWPLNWGVAPYSNALLIHGPSGCGKTHLAFIWQQETNAYLVGPDEDLTIIIDKFENFIFEDIDHKIWDEIYLFHTFNLLHEKHKFILYTSSNFPNEISYKLPDLKSRFNSIMSVGITYPSDELIKIILMRYFSEYKLKITLEVLNYMAIRVPRIFAEIKNIVALIDKIALAEKRNITIPLVKYVLGL